MLIIAKELKVKEKGEFVMVEAEKKEDVIDWSLLDLGERDSKLILQVMKGVNKPYKLKIKRSVNGHHVFALIDNEESHNFKLMETINKLAKIKYGRDLF